MKKVVNPPAATRQILHAELDRILDDLPSFGVVTFTIVTASGMPARIDRTVSRTLRLESSKDQKDASRTTDYDSRKCTAKGDI